MEERVERGKEMMNVNTMLNDGLGDEEYIWRNKVLILAEKSRQDYASLRKNADHCG